MQVVNLGNKIREKQSEGSLLSLKTPTIGGYIVFFEMCRKMKNYSPRQILECTLLGNANKEDSKVLPQIISEVLSVDQVKPGSKKVEQFANT